MERKNLLFSKQTWGMLISVAVAYYAGSQGIPVTPDVVQPIADGAITGVEQAIVGISAAVGGILSIFGMFAKDRKPLKLPIIGEKKSLIFLCVFPSFGLAACSHVQVDRQQLASTLTFIESDILAFHQMLGDDEDLGPKISSVLPHIQHAAAAARVWAADPSADDPTPILNAAFWVASIEIRKIKDDDRRRKAAAVMLAAHFALRSIGMKLEPLRAVEPPQPVGLDPHNLRAMGMSTVFALSGSFPEG